MIMYSNVWCIAIKSMYDSMLISRIYKVIFANLRHID